MTSQSCGSVLTIRVLNSVYGLTPAKDFGPLALKAVRQQMIEKGWVRDTVNAAVGRVRRIFKHAVANPIIATGVTPKAASLLPAHGPHRSPRPASPTAVPDTAIEAVKGRVSDLVKDLIDLQRLTVWLGELLG